MKLKLSWTILFILLITATYGFQLFAQSSENTSIKKCSSSNLDYEVVFEHRNSLPPYILGANIVVKSKNYNKEFMTKLAEELAARYCNEKEISITIFDNKKVAKRTDMFNYLLGKTIVPEVRGFFTRSIEKSHLGIVFSTKQGDPPDEVNINLPVKN